MGGKTRVLLGLADSFRTDDVIYIWCWKISDDIDSEIQTSIGVRCWALKLVIRSVSGSSYKVSEAEWA